MHFSSFLVGFLSLLGLTLSKPITEPVTELNKNTTDPSIFSTRQVNSEPWPGCQPHWGKCQLGSWQSNTNPAMALHLYDFYCHQIGWNPSVQNLGFGGSFGFNSQLPYVVIVVKYYQVNDLPPYIWYKGEKTGDVFQASDRTCYDWQGGKFCYLRFNC